MVQNDTDFKKKVLKTYKNIINVGCPISDRVPINAVEYSRYSDV